MSNLGSRVFVAERFSWCRNADCSGIKEGDRAFFAMGESTPQHVPGECRIDDPMKVRTWICGKCFMEKSVTGECGCDE